MTDRIDLDELAGSEDGSADESNRGDWLWRPDEDTDATAHDTGDADEPGSPGGTGPLDRNGRAEGDAEDGEASPGTASTVVGEDPPTPHVPRANKDRPVGIPVEGGGAGGGQRPGGGEAHREADGAPSGPHGGDADDMTMAITYRAATRLADPAGVLADAARWADWLGIVGDVEAHVINKFQRDHGVDVDFFNGTGSGPGERLAEIDERSMFFADRMVVVGVEDEDEPIARSADWEFVSLETAADEADWDLNA